MVARSWRFQYRPQPPHNITAAKLPQGMAIDLNIGGIALSDLTRFWTANTFENDKPFHNIIDSWKQFVIWKVLTGQDQVIVIIITINGSFLYLIIIN